MRRVKLAFLLAGSLFSLITCSQVPVTVSEATPIAPSETFTPYDAGTEAALATPTPWVEGTQTALALASASPTPLPLPTITSPSLPTVTPNVSFSPIFHAFKDSPAQILLGGVMEGRGWLSAEQASAYIRPSINYDFFSPNATAHLEGRALEFSPVCRNYFLEASEVMPAAMVGVASHWIVERRNVQDLSTDDPTYVQALTEWFHAQGDSPSEIHITRILQVDIERDGVNEVLLSASYFEDASGHMTETGDYSVVLMRKVIGNEVLTIPLISEFYVTGAPELSFPNTYTLTDAIDLNQDGTLEVVVGVSRWEGLGGLLFRVDGQNVREVLRAICPAP